MLDAALLIMVNILRIIIIAFPQQNKHLNTVLRSILSPIYPHQAKKMKKVPPLISIEFLTQNKSIQWIILKVRSIDLETSFNPLKQQEQRNRKETIQEGISPCGME